MTNDLRARFEDVYNSNAWGDQESVSGWGSREDSHSVILSLEVLQTIISRYQIKTLADIPCGDFNWMRRFVDANKGIDYTGFDIVTPLIEKNKSKYPNFKFGALNICEETPPRFDMIFCKDLLNHLLYTDIARALKNIKNSGTKYLLASNNFGWNNTELAENVGGASRHLDICLAPLCFPPPIWNTDYLGLWDLAEIDDAYLDLIIENTRQNTDSAAAQTAIRSYALTALRQGAASVERYARWMDKLAK